MCGKSADSDGGALAALAARLADASKILLVAHARPDGDALASMRVLALAAEQAGKTVYMLVPDAVPQRLAFLLGDSACAGPDRFDTLADGADLIVILDTCSAAQLDDIADAVIARREKVGVIDHHTTCDDIADVVWIDTSAAATGVMVGELIDHLGWPLTTDSAEALVVAVATDTGWLRFANTDGRALRAVGRWVDMGVRTDILYRRIYQNARPQRLRLIARAIESLELHYDGRLAVMSLRRRDFAETGAREDETENIVNEALRIGTVESAFIVVENTDHVRASLRSRDLVDVAALAARFGGGGHPRAAGLRSTEDFETLKAKLIEAWGDAASR